MKSKMIFASLLFLLSLSTQSFALTLEQQTTVYDSFASERSGDLAKAIEKMVSILQYSPNDYFVNLRLGWLFFSAKKYKNSADHYERASHQDPASVEPLLGLSLVYVTTGTYDKAARTCLLLLQRDPRNYLGMQRLISSEIRLRDFPHAIERAADAVKLYPTDPVFLEQQAFILKEMGKSQEAKAAISTLLLVSPQNEYARAQLTVK